MGYQPKPAPARRCEVLHRTAALERELYGKVVSHSVEIHVRDCLPSAGQVPKPPAGPGGGSRSA